MRQKNRGSFALLVALALLGLFNGAHQLKVDHIFYNCSINNSRYFSQSEFQCLDCGTNQVTDAWRQCQCSAGFKATLAVREANPAISYPCTTACAWSSDSYCRPADASGCVPYTTIKRIVGFAEKSPYVCMACSYGDRSEYSCRCPADTATVRYKPAFPNTCVETDPTQELAATWQIIGNTQSLTFKCMLQRVSLPNIKAIFLCRKNDPEACSQLANLCTLSDYRADREACKVFYALQSNKLIFSSDFE